MVKVVKNIALFYVMMFHKSELVNFISAIYCTVTVTALSPCVELQLTQGYIIFKNEFCRKTYCVQKAPFPSKPSSYQRFHFLVFFQSSKLHSLEYIVHFQWNERFYISVICYFIYCLMYISVCFATFIKKDKTLTWCSP